MPLGPHPLKLISQPGSAKTGRSCRSQKSKLMRFLKRVKSNCKQQANMALPGPILAGTSVGDCIVGPGKNRGAGARPNSWYYLVVTYDGSRVTRGMNMYVNRASVSYSAGRKTIPGLKLSVLASWPARIGDRN